MMIHPLVFPAILSLTSLVTAYVEASTSLSDALADTAAMNLTSYYALRRSYTSCDIAKAQVRKEWGALSTGEKEDFIESVICLTQKDPLNNATKYPGIKSRYDDFVGLHINRTTMVHFDAYFLPFHRLFIHVFEQTLRTECGFTGTLPYWNWPRWTSAPLDSPLFDGSATSLGGNGVYMPHNCSIPLSPTVPCIPAGQGGGCVKDGPFVNHTVNMGPILPVLNVEGIEPVQGMYDYNPRCIRRDISTWAMEEWLKDSDVADVVAGSADIGTFQFLLQGNSSAGSYGVHGTGHVGLVGDPMGDLYASPGDPVFWLHHAGIDRLWWMWQNQDPATRSLEISGTITELNDPPSRDGTIDDILDMGVVGESMEIEHLVSTLGLYGGPLCYTYE